MLNKLTQAQLDRLPAIREEWLRIGLSCEPTNLDAAKRAIAAIYAEAKLPPPQVYILLDSPLSAAIGAAMLKAQVGDQVRDQVGDQVRDQVWDQVGDQVRDQVGDQVRDQVWDQVRDQVGDQVRDQVGAQVGAQVWAQVRDQVWAQVRDQVGAQVFGSHDAGWLSFYAAFMEFGIGATARLSGLMDLAKNCGWWAPYQGVAIVQHRHSELHRDEDGRLHNERGMSVRYRDGFGVWAIRGVRVDEQIVMRPESQSIQQIHKEASEEVRRIRIERYGWSNYLADSGAKVVDKRKNSRDAQMETLYRLHDGTQRIMCTDPSTGRRYALGVPREIQTCEQAQNWMSHGLDSLAIHRS